MIFFMVCGAAFVGALIYTRMGRATLATVMAPAVVAPPQSSGFAGSFRDLDSLADSQAYEMLGREYVANRAKRRAVEIQGDLPSDPKGESVVKL